MRRLLGPILLAVLLLAACGRSAQPAATGPQPSRAAGQPKVTFIELGSVNCIPCKAMQPVMREVEQRFPRDVKVVFYDVWTEAQQRYAADYGIRVIPTQVFLDASGKEFFRHEGFFPADALIALLQKRGVKE